MSMSYTDNILRVLAAMRIRLATGPTSRISLDDGFNLGNEFVYPVSDLLGRSKWFGFFQG
jgi:hypothetical protein